VVANGTATTGKPAAGRRRREVELYQGGPRQKRAVMTVCDPRQVFGALINYVDDLHFKVF